MVSSLRAAASLSWRMENLSVRSGVPAARARRTRQPARWARRLSNSVRPGIRATRGGLALERQFGVTEILVVNTIYPILPPPPPCPIPLLPPSPATPPPPH